MSLVEALALRRRELVAFVGGGGKTTTMLALAGELGRGGDRRVLLTTTTMIGANQTAGLPVCRSPDEVVDFWREGERIVWLLASRQGGKAGGPGPEAIDAFFREYSPDYVLTEADGARGRPLKAPGTGEPVVPGTTTLTVVMMGIDAVGRTVAEASHRVDRVRALTGLTPETRLGPADCANVLGHPEGGLRGIPSTSRVLVALSKVRSGPRSRAAAEIGRLLSGNERISELVTIPEGSAPTGA